MDSFTKSAEDRVHCAICEHFRGIAWPIPGQEATVIVAGLGFKVQFPRRGVCEVRALYCFRNVWISKIAEDEVLRGIKDKRLDFESLTLLADYSDSVVNG